jgi:hypothetical protein
MELALWEPVSYIRVLSTSASGVCQTLPFMGRGLLVGPAPYPVSK